jgi:AcrR family transcriptional regulator
MTTRVSQETLAQRRRRRYVSAARTHQGEATRKRLIEAVVAFAQAGNFRPSGLEIARRAGVHSSTITRQFGSLELLNRCVAREHAEAIVVAADIVSADDGMHATRDVAWLILVGKPREMP